MNTDIHKRERERGESKLRFQVRSNQFILIYYFVQDKTDQWLKSVPFMFYLIATNQSK